MYTFYSNVYGVKYDNYEVSSFGNVRNKKLNCFL